MLTPTHTVRKHQKWTTPPCRHRVHPVPDNPAPCSVPLADARCSCAVQRTCDKQRHATVPLRRIQRPRRKVPGRCRRQRKYPRGHSADRPNWHQQPEGMCCRRRWRCAWKERCTFCYQVITLTHRAPAVQGGCVTLFSWHETQTVETLTFTPFLFCLLADSSCAGSPRATFAAWHGTQRAASWHLPRQAAT